MNCLVILFFTLTTTLFLHPSEGGFRVKQFASKDEPDLCYINKYDDDGRKVDGEWNYMYVGDEPILLKNCFKVSCSRDRNLVTVNYEETVSQLSGYDSRCWITNTEEQMWPTCAHPSLKCPEGVITSISAVL